MKSTSTPVEVSTSRQQNTTPYRRGEHCSSVKIYKKVLSLFLSLVMLFSITAGLDFSAYATTSGDYKYSVQSDGSAKITKYSGKSKNLKIPSKIGKYTVKSIGRSAFSCCNSLENVTIPNTITSVGDCAFDSCKNLKSAKIPNSVKKLGNATFSYCGKLTSVTIGNGVTSIGEYAFADCKKLKNITLGNDVKSIGYLAFCGCTSLTSITFGDSVTIIDPEAFLYCDNLANINVNSNNTKYSSKDGVLFNKDKTKIIYYPLGNKRTSYTIPNTVTSIESYAFENNAYLKKLNIPNSVVNIGLDAFRGSNIYYNENNWINGVLYISNALIAVDDSFYGSYEIEDDTSVIAEGAFNRCEYLTNINVNSNNKNYSSKDGVLFNKNKTKLIYYPSANSRKSYTITNGVTSIDFLAFYYCKYLTSVSIPNSITSIADLEFFNCNSLTSINVDTGNKFYSSKDGVLFNKNKTKLICYPAGNKRKSYSIPSSVTIIGQYSFDSCSKLQSVTIPTSVKSIEDYAFWQGLKLKNVYYCGTLSQWNKIKISSWNFENEKIHYTDASLSTTSYTYNGKVKTPSVTVKDAKGKKIDKKYYTVSYSKGRKSVGQYTVTIKFKGNYSGTVKKTFTIKPKATTISKVTAGKKAFTVKWKKQTSQTTGYQIQYSTSSKFKGAKTVTITKNKTTSKKISKLKSKKKYYVRVRTYKTVKVNGKNTKIYSGWSKVKTVKTK